MLIEYIQAESYSVSIINYQVVKPKENIVEKEGVPQHYTASIEQLLTMIKLGHLLSQFDAVHLMALKYHCYNSPCSLCVQRPIFLSITL